MAGLYKRGNKWGAIFYANGKKIRTSTKIDIISKDGRTAAQNKKLAQQVADAMERQAKGGTSGASFAATLRAMADSYDDTPTLTIRQYLETYKPAGKAQNQYNALRAIKLFLQFLTERQLDGFALSEIKRKHCLDFLGERIQDVAEGTVKMYRAHLAAAFNRAIADELIVTNPFKLVNMEDVINLYSAELKGRDVSEREPFTAEEMKIILYDFPQPYCDLAAVSFFTGGQRIGDCIALTWKQIDFENNSIHLITTKTAKKLEQPLVPELRRRLELRRAQATDPDEEYVFPALVEAKKKSSGVVSTEFTHLLRTFGILKEEPVSTKKGRRRQVVKKSFHSIRHTVVSFMRSAGVAADVSRAVVGHDSEAVERAYFKASTEAKTDALSVLERAVESQVSED